MKLAWWMLSGSVLSSLLITTLLFTEARREVWFGMLGPLASAAVSWIAIERQFARRPTGLTGFLIKAFAAKIVFFGVYVTALLKVGIVRPFPFVVSFMSYFVALHVLEATGLHRLQAGVLKGNK
jgi:hypothetical protein